MGVGLLELLAARSAPPATGGRRPSLSSPRAAARNSRAPELDRHVT
ncbi:hypothetical protein KCH_33640 [Kitasatospora cheerisanensis KCTC 2395]|uniref:Uncharacterized protein n=1 Tax=Kitasatospora cheerisanensis KCTC 2395 TaxID=1348663 RepID=A0A066YUC8_9ACTN|nr:hypothetical protein KCH_33640 [Kitasatospora cheerisanensis KCTC 2395]